MAHCYFHSAYATRLAWPPIPGHVTAFGLIGIGDACKSAIPFGFVQFPFSVVDPLVPQAVILPHSTLTLDSKECEDLHKGSQFVAQMQTEEIPFGGTAFDYFVVPGLIASKQAQQAIVLQDKDGATQNASQGVGVIQLWVWVDGVVWTDGTILSSCRHNTLGTPAIGTGACRRTSGSAPSYS